MASLHVARCSRSQQSSRSSRKRSGFCLFLWRWLGVLALGDSSVLRSAHVKFCHCRRSTVRTTVCNIRCTVPNSAGEGEAG